MCGRYNINTNAEALLEAFEIAFEIDDDSCFKNYNACPSQFLPVILQDNGDRKMAAYQWGLIPFWWKKGAPKPFTNAVSETAFEKPSFKNSIRHKRCLVPVSGWYEWKRPERIPFNHLLPGENIFALAGLWDEWGDFQSPLRTFALLTTEACEQAANVHTRMPVIVTPDDYAAWLDPVTSEESVREIMQPYADELDIYEVSRAVNQAGNNEPQLLNRL